MDLSEWCPNTLLKYYKKVEKVGNLTLEDKKYRGHSGPISVEENSLK